MTFTIFELALCTGLAFAAGIAAHQLWLRRQDRKSTSRVLILDNQDITVMLSRAAVDRLMLSQSAEPRTGLH